MTKCGPVSTMLLVLVMMGVAGCGRSDIPSGNVSGGGDSLGTAGSTGGRPVPFGGTTGDASSAAATGATGWKIGSGGTTGAPVSPGAFVPTGSLRMIDIHRNTATLLPNGKVLIVGNGMAELYDPNTETFASTGNMTAERYSHTATLLPDGRVLVAGGESGWKGNPMQHPLASAELYDPLAGTFTATGNMTVARGAPTATLLPNGMVLIAGGGDNNVQSRASAELYDPATGTFTQIGNMIAERWFHTATLMPNGLVLLVGGFGDSSPWPVESAELYDPAAGTFTATGSMRTARGTHTATLLRNGMVIIVGGYGDDNCARSTCALTGAELYDPATRTFFPTGDMTIDRVFHTATLLGNGKVLIAGGQESAGTQASYVFLASAELYDPVTGRFTVTGSMATPRVEHTATLLGSGKVLMVGGSLTSAELYQ